MNEEKAFVCTYYSLHDIFMATREIALTSDKLTKKQKGWLVAYFSSHDETISEPTDAAVARVLGISRVASSTMKKRLIRILSPYFNRHLQDKLDDEDLLVVYEAVEKKLRTIPAYLEKRRGKKGYMLWKVSDWSQGNEKHWIHERLGRPYMTGYEGQEIENLGGFENLEIIYTTEHKSSLLSDWWFSKSMELSEHENISFGEAYDKLQHFFMDKWQKVRYSRFEDTVPFKERHCRFCNQLMPLGEIIEGKKVTPRRHYCSNSCKVQHSRVVRRKRKITARQKSVFKKNLHILKTK